MATTKLVIRSNRVNVDGKTPVYIRYTHNEKSFLISTGEKIAPKDWNEKEQKVRKTYGKGHSTLNDSLHDKQRDIDQLRRNEEAKGHEPTIEHIRSILAEHEKERKYTQSSFFQLWDEYIANKRPTTSNTTIKHYITSKNHLQRFASTKKINIEFANIDKKFYEAFVNYLFEDLGLSNNTVGTEIKQLKTFLHYWTERGYNTNLSFTKFKKPSSPAQIIVLSKSDLDKMGDLELKPGSRLRKIRDVFLVGTQTGLRHSDLIRIQKSNVQGGELSIHPLKTKDEQLVIPLTRIAQNILQEYKYTLPAISNQKFNDGLKDLGKMLDYTEPVVIKKFNGGKASEITLQKWELLTSHCARRTFITQSLERGMRPEVIMQITGHRSLKTFQKYIKITEQVKKEEMMRAWG